MIGAHSTLYMINYYKDFIIVDYYPDWDESFCLKIKRKDIHKYLNLNRKTSEYYRNKFMKLISAAYTYNSEKEANSQKEY